MESNRHKRVPVTTAWLVPQVADGGTASNTEGRGQYIEKSVADRRQGVVLQFGGLGEVLTITHPKMYCVTYRSQRNPRTWTDTLVRSKQWKTDMRFGTWNARSLYRSGSLTAEDGSSGNGMWKHELDRSGSG